MPTSLRVVLLAAVAASGLLASGAAAQMPDLPPPPSVPTVEIRGPGRAAPVVRSGPPTFQGVLTDSDPVREGGRAYDSYPLDVREGDEVTVTMTADDFDTYLVVRSPAGQEWTNDDFGSTRVSQVTFRAAERGSYTVIATAYSSSGRGSYEVSVSTVRAVVVSTVAGRLDYQDLQQIKGEFYDEVTVRSPASGSFYVELVPLGFTGYLRVTSPGGSVTRSDEQGSGSTTTRVGPLRAERGEWRVDVTSGGGGSPVGAYDLRVVTLDDQR